MQHILCSVLFTVKHEIPPLSWFMIPPGNGTNWEKVTKGLRFFLELWFCLLMHSKVASSSSAESPKAIVESLWETKYRFKFPMAEGSSVGARKVKVFWENTGWHSPKSMAPSLFGMDSLLQTLSREWTLKPLARFQICTCRMREIFPVGH